MYGAKSPADFNRDNVGPDMMTLETPKEDHIYYIWRKMVSNYSIGNLTVGSDKLVAVAGRAKLMGQPLGESDQYCAGLWRRHFPLQML
jgi:hypothetical protein